MINNDTSSQLSRYFSRPAAGSGGAAQEAIEKIKARHDSLLGRNQGEDAEKETKDSGAAKDTASIGTFGNGYIYKKTRPEDKQTAAQPQTKTDDADDLTPEERRQKELKDILDRINAEEAQRYPGRTKKTEEAAAAGVITAETDGEKISGFPEFLNDMPLFSEFKQGLVDAFTRLDSASAGFISAQYELNYTSMQYIADAAGNYEYKETSFSLKLDLTYIKAAGGGQSSKEIADLINSSEDFQSLVNNLQSIGMNQAGQTPQSSFSPNDIMSGLNDYFSPEKTADRILDFSTAFFPLSDAYKKHGDTEEGREEFAKLMRGAIQKGFDQAMGKLGRVPASVQEGIDKTHELVFKGIDDFVKNGINRNKEESGLYSSLQQFAFSFEMSYSQKTVSGTTYGAGGEKQTAPAASALDTQA